MAIVYQHRRIDTGEVFYVGIGKADKRAYQTTQRSKFWRDFIKNHDYVVEITHRDIIWEEACVIERYLIAFYGRRDLGLGSLINLTDGGEGLNGYKDTKERIEEKRKFIYENNPMRFEENRKKVSLSKLGKKRPDLSLRNTLNNPTKDKKVVEKIRLSNLGNKHWLGKQHSIETKNKLKEINIKKFENLSIEEKRKYSDRMNIILTCEHCNKKMTKGNYSRWHGDKCKNKKYE